jgi:hypothetical protein
MKATRKSKTKKSKPRTMSLKKVQTRATSSTSTKKSELWATKKPKDVYVVYNPHTKQYLRTGYGRLTHDSGDAKKWKCLENAEDAALDLEACAVRVGLDDEHTGEYGWGEHDREVGPVVGWGVYELKTTTGRRISESLTKEARRDVFGRRRDLDRWEEEDRLEQAKEKERVRRIAQVDKDLKNWKPT